jgi:hypothetical protein
MTVADGETEMRWSTLALLAVLVVAPAAHAKGIFQAEGAISELQRHGDEVTFRFVGKLSFGYATAPDSDPRRQWKDLSFVATDIAVRVDGWTRARSPAVRADDAEVDQIFAKLAELQKTGRAVRFSLDNPNLSFSNVGQLVRASGTFIYAVDSGR